jgi:DNA (cytosine-5)-methyltransferase 1
MSRPRLLDLFCGAGGAAEGYRRAGFDVTGVDLEPHEFPPGDFVQADALQILAAPAFLASFDVVHASPPCQRFSTITPSAARADHLDLIAPVRDLLRAWGGPYVIENVEGARRELIDPVRLCGSSFGLRVRRHRWFESNVWLMSLPCRHVEQGEAIGVYGSHGDNSYTYRRPDGTKRGTRAANAADAGDALGIDWMDWGDLAESIPPAYTEWIGDQLRRALDRPSLACLEEELA